MFDAREMLAQFMINGHPSNKLFAGTVGKLLSAARQKAVETERGLMVFGEMVAVLWADGNTVGALELERIWNDVLHDHPFHLHCAYPRWILNDNSSNVMIKSICDEHSSVLGHATYLQGRSAASN